MDYKKILICLAIVLFIIWFFRKDKKETKKLIKNRPEIAVNIDMYTGTAAWMSIDTVKPGTTVYWTNVGTKPMTITSKDGLFTSDDIQPGENYSYTFYGTGRYEYYSRHDPETVGGFLTVEE